MSHQHKASDKYSSNQENEETESEDHFCPKENANDYKGIFYGDSNEHKFFEFGSHFQYDDLCRRLEYLKSHLNTERGEVYFEIEDDVTSKESLTSQSKHN